ncbi:MAG: hypothetical protein WBG90_00935 [Saonia sp.]
MKNSKKIQLSLNKRVVSNFTANALTGGSSISRGGCGAGQSLQGGCGTGGPAPSGNPGCNHQ